MKKLIKISMFFVIAVADIYLVNRCFDFLNMSDDFLFALGIIGFPILVMGNYFVIKKIVKK